MENPGEHVEQAEQAQEALSDPFNRRVTLSIAIVAACLAAVSMLGQNADNDALLAQGEALRKQGDALRKMTIAALKSNEATNKWGQYQANNIRGHMYKAFADSASIQQNLTDKSPAMIEAWLKRFDDYENTRLPKMGKEAEALVSESRKNMEAADDVLAEMEETLKESEINQKKGDRFDLGELGLQLGVVLCSLAILTRNKGFWAAGILCSLAGFLMALSGFFGWFMG